MEPIWYPSEAYWHGSWLERLCAHMGEADYEGLYRRSLEEPDRFWAAFLDLIGLCWERPYERFWDLSAGPAWARFFVGGRLNAAHNALRWAEGGAADRPALLWEREDGLGGQWTYDELAARVKRLMSGWAQRGFAAGDRVGLLMPMRPEAVVALLAVAGLGGVAVPLFSGFGPEAVRARLADAEARWLVVACRTSRRGVSVDLLAVAREAVRGLHPKPQVLVLEPDRPLEPHESPWEALEGPSTAAIWASVEAETPCMLLYTSGTTGRPKACVHVHGGFPLKAALDMALLFDLRSGERMLWVTDLGWMMGPWLIWGALLLGGTAVLYEGAPDWPGADRLWRLVERHRITHLGLSPTLVRALMARGVLPPQLESLRLLGSTGEPWNPDPYRWLFEAVGQSRRPIINYSGGTEVSGGFWAASSRGPSRPRALTPRFRVWMPWF